MSLLPYCVLLANVARDIPSAGVLEASIETFHQGELAVPFSQIEKNRIMAANIQENALAFHRVVHTLFSNAALVPFRFPTWLSAAELEDHLRKDSWRYQAFLTRYANHVQMELRVTAPLAAASAATGTEHLRTRADHLHRIERRALELKDRLADDVLAWRERDIPEGKRIYALVERDRLASFRERLSGQSLSYSGPWPATEFFAARS